MALGSAARAAETADPFLWLEDVTGPRAMTWVRAENARTVGVLEGDHRFAGLDADALKIAEAVDRIPTPELIGDQVYNFWRDDAHVRGVWRRTSKADYARADPHWATVLDLDQLAASEHANWVWEGANCPPPTYKRCMIALSDGGEDATTEREFDLTTKAFVPGGFVLPHSKQTVDWLDDDTLIVSRDWGPGTMTASGYPFVVKTLKRGQNLDQAFEVYRGQPSDVSVDPLVLHDGQGHKDALITRGIDFFHSETRDLSIGYGVTHLSGGKPIVRLALPDQVTINGLLDGRLIFTTEQEWTFGGVYKAGSLLAFTPASLAAPPPTTLAWENGSHLIFEPTARQTVDEVGVTRGRVVASIYDNVRGGLVSFRPVDGQGWERVALPVAANSSVGIATANDLDDGLYYNVSGFLDPPRLYQADAANGVASLMKSLPARFDASRDAVDQYEAASTDGTKIPYFVVHPKGMALDGANPTILYAYGSFQVSETPFYSGIDGKLWLERGGVFVLANIRGGGEFGPAWHEAALKTHRQVAFDDFAAVGRDLIARKITSPRRLGIQGGSNGGLLMGVEFTQHPELWRAVDIQVPLLDMLRYEQIAAGASWVGEYGSAANPKERAFLASISPYANLKAGVAYPEPFVWTTSKDDRVGPQHARKFAAALAALGDPYLFYEVIEGGHGAGANLKEDAHTEALEMTYFIRKLMD
ncbi:MAG TPA: prolyl oligopeptidase family serine peptidase [Caulobacteraceae bacterium]